jgi:hypothetical protein
LERQLGGHRIDVRATPDPIRTEKLAFTHDGSSRV